MAGGSPHTYGLVKRVCTGVEGGRQYDVHAWVRSENIRSTHGVITLRVVWRETGAFRASLRRDYICAQRNQGEWRLLTGTLTAPPGSRMVEIELGLQGEGTAFWDAVTIDRVADRLPRKVRLATTHVYAENMTPEENRALFEAIIEKAGRENPDLICLTEVITSMGTGRSAYETAEPIPGPTTYLLGEKARQLRSYVVASIHERAAEGVYNTAVVIDRQGNVMGKYRKTHIPTAEAEGGVLSGETYPVFDLDFGRLGVLICWDCFFPEPARILALKGAQLIAVPIQADPRKRETNDGRRARAWDIVPAARAIDNGVYWVSWQDLSFMERRPETYADLMVPELWERSIADRPAQAVSSASSDTPTRVDPASAVRDRPR